MDFQILGPLEVRSERGAVGLGGLKPRAVLAVLLLHANEPVSAERLAVALWGEDAPAGAVKTVQVHVSRLRKALGDPEAVDHHAGGVPAAGAPGRARRRALRAWRGGGSARARGGRCRARGGRVARGAGAVARAGAGGPGVRAVRGGGDRAAWRSSAWSRWRRAWRPTRPRARMLRWSSELQQLRGRAPDARAAARLQLMLALYRSGRQAEALEVYRDARQILVEELGVEPGAELQRLHAGDPAPGPALDLPTRVRRAEPHAAERRLGAAARCRRLRTGRSVAGARSARSPSGCERAPFGC